MIHNRRVISCRKTIFRWVFGSLPYKWVGMTVLPSLHITVGQNNQECRLKYWTTRSLTPLTCLLAPPYSFCSRTPLRYLVCLHAHFAHSLARRTVIRWLFILCLLSVLAYIACLFISSWIWELYQIYVYLA